MILTVIKDDYFINHILYCFNDFINTLSNCKTYNNFIVNSFDSKDININTNLIKNSDYIYLSGLSGLNNNTILKIKRNGTKIVVFWDDIHYYNDSVLNNRIEMFTIADIILLPYHKQFLKREEYKNFWDKSFLFPWYGPNICYDLNNNFNLRYDNAILTGRISDAYPFRQMIRNYIDKQSYIALLEHPGYDRNNRKHNIIHNKFYELISKYKVAIVTTAVKPLSYTIAKYFEAPACGCACFMQETEDMKELGFIDGVNFISINENNYKNINNLVKEYDLELISNNSLKLVKEKHSIFNRIELLFNILNNNSRNL
jgi:hypothetical protein